MSCRPVPVWQTIVAACGTATAGTLDPTTYTEEPSRAAERAAITPTDLRSVSRSRREIYGPVGNVFQWTADWMKADTDVDDAAITTGPSDYDRVFGLNQSNEFLSESDVVTSQGLRAAVLRARIVKDTWTEGDGVFATDPRKEPSIGGLTTPGLRLGW